MFKGSMPALVTPFANGKVDEKALVKLVNWQIEQGSTGLVPVGTTGESPTLTHAEDELVTEIVIETAAGRVPVIAGAGSNNTTEALRKVKFVTDAKADAALVVTPYYNKPTQAGLIAHFTALNEASGIPIFIYNIPGRSVVDMSPATMGALAKLDKIIGVKDATGDLSRVASQRLSCGGDFIQLSGDDATAVGFNAMGGVGMISVTANVAPKLCAQMQEATLKGDFEAALALQDLLMPLHEAIFTEPGLCGAKAGLQILGMCSDDVRLPLLPVTSETRKKIEAAMKHAGVI